MTTPELEDVLKVRKQKKRTTQRKCTCQFFIENGNREASSWCRRIKKYMKIQEKVTLNTVTTDR